MPALKSRTEADRRYEAKRAKEKATIIIRVEPSLKEIITLAAAKRGTTVTGLISDMIAEL